MVPQIPIHVQNHCALVAVHHAHRLEVYAQYQINIAVLTYYITDTLRGEYQQTVNNIEFV